MAQGIKGSGGSCSIDGCDRPHLARSYCGLHYQRLIRNGEPGIAKRRIRVSPKRIDKTHWTEANIAWLAGIVEGEGTLALPGSTTGPRITVAMTDRDIVDRVASIAGCGLVNRYEPKSPTQQTQWHWKLNRQAQVLEVITALLPWFGERRTERAVAIIDHLLPALRDPA